MTMIQIKQSFQNAIADRGYLTAFIASGLVFIADLILCIVEIRPNDLQVPIRYTAFGITNIYRAQWFHELSFVLFLVLVFVLHTLISLKLFQVKNRTYAVAFQWLTAVMLGIAFLFFMTIFRMISIIE